MAVAPYMYDLAAVAAGISVRDFSHNAQAMVRAQLALHEMVGQDVIAIGSDNYYIAEGFGCRTVDEEDELVDVTDMFRTLWVRRLLVMRGDKVVGVISRRDLIRYVLNQRGQTTAPEGVTP